MKPFMPYCPDCKRRLKRKQAVDTHLPMPQTPQVEKHFIASETIRDIMIGMSDGLTVSFALAAGLSGAIEAADLIITEGGLAAMAAFAMTNAIP